MTTKRVIEAELISEGANLMRRDRIECPYCGNTDVVARVNGHMYEHYDPDTQKTCLASRAGLDTDQARELRANSTAFPRVSVRWQRESDDGSFVFKSSIPIHEGEEVCIYRHQRATSPLADAIFSLNDHFREVEIYNRHVMVFRDPVEPWHLTELEDICNVIRRQLASAEPAIPRYVMYPQKGQPMQANAPIPDEVIDATVTSFEAHSSEGSNLPCAPEERRTVEKQYLDGERYDLGRIRTEIEGFMVTAMNSMFEVGKRLMAVKAIEGYGNFLTWLENSELPFNHRAAQMYMGVARAVIMRPELRRLTGMGLSKANLLLGLPEPCLEEISTEGTLGGEPIDTYEAMTRVELQRSVRSLKKRLTEAAQDNDKTLDDVEAKNALIGELKAQVYDLQHGRQSTEAQQAFGERLGAFQKTIEQLCGFLEKADVQTLGDDLGARMEALASWAVYRTERVQLSVRERLAEVGWTVAAPSDLEWQENEARTATFKEHYEPSPL